MKRDSKLFIKDIIEAMEVIEKFVGNMTFEELKADEKTSSAVIRKFEVIGEAAKYMPNNVKERYKDVQWKSMAGMRDRLIHAYFGIDYALVWSAIKTEFPKLKPKMKKIFLSMEQEEKEDSKK